jgi:hypothetical protein
VNGKALAILVVATAGLSVAAYLATRGGGVEQSKTPANVEAALFPDLAKSLAAARTIEIRDGQRTVTLARAQATDPWTIRDKHGYPASDRVASLISSIASARIVEEKTSKPERYALLGVAGASEAGSTSREIALKDESGKPVLGLIVGNAAEPGVTGSRGGVFVRRLGEAVSYLATGTIMADTDPMSWLDRVVLQVERNRLHSVRITRHEDGPVGEDPAQTPILDLVRANETDLNFAVRNMPPGRELRAPAAADSPSQSLGYFSIEDVKPRAEVNFEVSEAAGPVAGDDRAPFARATSRFTTFDGLVFTVRVTRQAGVHWAAIDVAFDENEVVPEGERAEGSPPSKRKPADEVRKEAADLGAKLGPWAFAISEWNARQLSGRLTDLLKPVEKPETVGPQKPDGVVDSPLPAQGPG